MPTVSSTTNAAILTGAAPERTGIVSNQFHIPGTPAGRIAMGMDTEIDAETLIDAARRAGKRVGCITFPTVDATTPRRSADWGLIWHSAAAPSRMIRLTRSDFHSDWLPPMWGAPQPRHTSFGPVMRARIEWSVPQRTREDVDIAAYDTTDDHVRNYDTFYIEHAGSETLVDSSRWFAVSSRLRDGVYGSWSKLVAVDPSLDSMTIYWGAINRTEGYPDSFVRLIDDEAGFWPGVPDEVSAKGWIVDRNGIDAETFIEQVNRLSAFLTRATTVAVRQMPFDLLLAYQPIIDESEHQFRIVSDSQAHATNENRAAAARVRAAAYAAFDRSVADLTAAIDPARDALVVTGDHGLATVDIEVRVNQMLVDWGFAKIAGETLAPDTHWAAYATGNVAHIYRFSGPDNTDELAKHLTDLNSPDGAPVFERVDRKTSSSHRNSGDLVAFSYPRFALSPVLGDAFVKPAYFGQHGGLNSHHEFQTSLGATGAGVFAETIATMRQTQVARYVCDLLGIAPPKQAEVAP
jgi:predicted AlkP superfamily phosphohydrolase/phosphomutase